MSGRRGEAPGGLDDDLHAQRKQPHLGAQLLVADRDDIGDQTLHDRERELSERRGLCAVGDGLRHRDAHDAPAAQRLLRVVARLRFHADDLALRGELGRGQRAAADQSSAAHAHHQIVECADFLDQLLRHRALAGDDVSVVEGRNQRAAALGDQALRERLAIFVHAVIEDDLGAVVAGGGELGRRRIAGHDDRRGHAQ